MIERSLLTGREALARRIAQALSPDPPCRECAERPAVVGVPEGAPEPEFPAQCPACGRVLPPVVLVIGVDADAI
jgi:hypothetical protein